MHGCRRHPGQRDLAGRAIQAAVAACGLLPAVFSLLLDGGYEVGGALVADPRIKAVGFTGSRRGGVALMRIANSAVSQMLGRVMRPHSRGNRRKVDK
jgi:acyl-CoA reductase-like NAD-dependent aldehyde dehydrogenase